MPSSLRVLIADDHALIREGLRSCFQAAEHLELVGEARNGWEAVDKALELNPDIILMDIHMPELNGLEATQMILKHQPQIAILILSVYDRKEYVRQFIESGARGYLLKDSDLHQVLNAIEVISAGKAYFSPEISSQILVEAQRGQSAQGTQTLTRREREIAELIARGLTTRLIAEKIGVASSTVKRHRANLMRKLNLSSASEVTRYAIQMGWVDPQLHTQV